MAENQQEQNIATVGVSPTVTRRSTADSTALTQGQAAGAIQNVVEVTMPWLLSSEQTMMALTTSGIDPADLATNGAGALTIGRYEGLRDFLSGKTPSQQRGIFHEQLTDEQRSGLRGVGYEPPTAASNEGNSGFMSALSTGLGWVGTGLSSVTSILPDPVREYGGKGLKTAFGGVVWAGDQPARLYRTIRSNPETEWIAGLAAAGTAIGVGVATKGRINPQTLGRFRALGALGGSALAGGTAASFAATALSSSDGYLRWWNSLQAAGNGEKVFGAEARSNVERRLNNAPEYVTLAQQIADDLDPMNLAEELAGVRGATRGDRLDINTLNQTIFEIAENYADPNTEEHRQVVATIKTLLEEDVFYDSVVELAQSKISFGRDVARTLRLDPGSSSYNLLSGTLDAGWLLALDPFLAIGPALKARRLGKYALLPKGEMTKTSFVDNLLALHESGNRRIVNFNNQIIGSVNRGDANMMPKTVRGLYGHIQRHIEATPNLSAETFGITDLFDVYRQQESIFFFMSGKGAVTGIENVVFRPVSDKTALGRLRKELLEFRDAVVEPARNRKLRKLAEKNGLNLDELMWADIDQLNLHSQVIPVEEITQRKLRLAEPGGIGQLLGRNFAYVDMATGGVFGKVMNLQTKLASRGYIDIENGDNIPEFMDNVAEIFNLPRWFRDTYLENAMRSTNPAARIQIVRSYISSVFELNGLGRVQGGREYIENFLRQHLQHFGPGEVDNFLQNPELGHVIGRGVLGGEVRELWAVPSAEKLLEVKRQIRVIDEMTGGALAKGRDLLDAATTNVWKPSVLISAKFIIRSTGEELLNALARGTEGAWGADLGSRVVARYDDYVAVMNKVNIEGIASLTPEQLRVYNWGNSRAGRMTTRLLSGTGDSNAVGVTTRNYQNWLYRVAKYGIKDGEYGNRLGNMNAWTQALVLGRRNSWTRTALTGIEPGLLRRADIWNRLHAKEVMREISAGSTGLSSEQIISDVDAISAIMTSGTDEITKVRVRPGVAQRYDQNNPQYEFAFHNSAREIFGDPEIGPVLLDFFPRVLPDNPNFNGEVFADLLENYANLSPLEQQLFDLIAFGHDDMLDAWADMLRADPAFTQENEYGKLATIAKRVSQETQISSSALDDLANGARILSMVRSLPTEDTALLNWYGMALFADAASLRSGNPIWSSKERLAQLRAGSVVTNEGDVGRRIYQSFDEARYDIKDQLNQIYLTGSGKDVFRRSDFLLRSQGEGYTLAEIPPVDSFPMFAPNWIRQDSLLSVFDSVATRVNPNDEIQFVDEIVREVMNGPAARSAANQLLTGDNYDELSNVLRMYIRNIYRNQYDPAVTSANAKVIQMRMTEPDTFVRSGADEFDAASLALDNPRIAQWVNDVLNDVQSSATPVANLVRTVPNRLRSAEASPSIVTVPGGRARPSGRTINTEFNGSDFNVYALDPGERLEFVLVNEIDPTLRPMAAQVDSFTDQNITRIRNTLFTGTKERVYTRAEIYEIDFNGNLIPVPEGTEVTDKLGNKKFFDVDRQELDARDRSMFDYAATQPEDADVMWDVVAPMVMDNFAHQRGREVLRRKLNVDSITTERATSRIKGQRVLADDLGDVEFVVRPYSRYDDISKYGEDAPDTVYGPQIEIDPDDLSPNKLRQGVSWFFEKNAAVIDALVRHPLAFHMFQRRVAENYRFINDLLNVADPNGARYVGAQMRETADGLLGRKGLSWFGEEFDLEVSALLRQYEDLGDNAYLFVIDDIFSYLDIQTLRLMRDGKISTDELFVRMYKAIYDSTPELNELRFGLANAISAAIADGATIGDVFGGADNLPKLLQELISFRSFRETAEERAALAAIDNVIPFIDSHKVKSLWSLKLKNIMPFRYAEENFIKRWVRTAGLQGFYGLEDLRKAQLAYNGLRSTGFIQTDSRGEDWFYYPGTTLMNEGLSRVFGDSPVPYVFKSRTDQLLPGFNEDVGKSGVGFAVAMPLAILENQMPEIHAFRRAIVGDIGATTGIEQIFPSPFRKLYAAYKGDPSADRAFAAAYNNAIANGFAYGNVPLGEQSARERQQTLDTFRDQARGILFTQAVLQLFTPGVPTPQAITEGAKETAWWTGLGVSTPADLLSSQYQSYIYTYGIDEGLQKFTEDFPNWGLKEIINPVAYTVSSTETVSGASLPATQQSIDFYLDNEPYANENPYGFGWFAPTPQLKDEFDQYAWAQQFNMDLRVRKEAGDFYDAIHYRQVAPVYFENKRKHELALASMTDDEERRLERVRYENEQEALMASNPLFRDILLNTGNKNIRERTINEIRVLVQDPEFVENSGSPYVQPISQLLENFDLYRALLKSRPTNKLADVEYRETIKGKFQNWIIQWLAQNPELNYLWAKTFEPESGFEGLLESEEL